jgi:hypothetical protein
VIPTAVIVRRLVAERWFRNFVVPSYTPQGWFECDVFEVTAAGYFREYEVKTSRADFLRDRDKAKSGYRPEPDAEGRLRLRKYAKETKHERLAARDVAGPTRFEFVMPEGLVTPDEVPEWAGLTEARETKYGVALVETRKAPQLHRRPADPKVVQHAKSVLYWRYHKVKHPPIECFAGGEGI